MRVVTVYMGSVLFLYHFIHSFLGHQPLQDLEIRVGNSSSELQRNPLCAWFPGTIGEFLNYLIGML